LQSIFQSENNTILLYTGLFFWFWVRNSVFSAGYQKQVKPAYSAGSKQVPPAFGSQLKKHW
jgi:hypothetical protein